MAEESIFFLPVRQVGRREVVTCAPGETVAAAAATMHEHNLSSLVVCRQGVPVGIVTDRDLRNKVVSCGADPTALTVETIMNAPLVTVGEEDSLFEAVYQMSRHGIHRVVVLDGAGTLAGIVTDSDILRLQTRSPQQLLREIEEAGSVEELRLLHARVQGLVGHMVGTGARIADLVRLIAHLNDRILLRLIAMLRRERFADLPDGFAFVVLGSEGRREQTLTTDQDNALVYADGLPPEALLRLEGFAQELIDRLVAIGVPPCPGGIMARNAAWRRSLGEWTDVLDGWIASATPENILNVSMFADLRTLCGDPVLERRLKEHLAARLQPGSIFLMRMAGNVLRFAPPLGWFGKIKTEREEEHHGHIDVKKAGIFAVTEGLKVLALEAGFLDGGTRERLQRLAAAGTFTRQEAEDLEAAFDFLVRLRLRGQVEALGEGREPTNHVPLDRLNRMEQGRLRLALEGVRSFQEFLRRRFSLDQIL